MIVRMKDASESSIVFRYLVANVANLTPNIGLSIACGCTKKITTLMCVWTCIRFNLCLTSLNFHLALLR